MSYSVPHQRSTPHRGSADKVLTFLLVKPPANPTKK
jgi:hypothetical protein